MDKTIMADKKTLIDSFESSSGEIIKVHVQEWKGNEYIDLRLWLVSKAVQDGEGRPTPAGLTFDVELLPRLIQALQRVKEANRY